MKPAEITDGLIELFSDPDNWTQGYSARDQFDNHTDPLGKKATCWCLVGGTVKVCPEESERLEFHLRLFKFLKVGLILFNDDKDMTAEKLVKKLKEFKEWLK